jgi:hypothetical protein
MYFIRDEASWLLMERIWWIVGMRACTSWILGSHPSIMVMFMPRMCNESSICLQVKGILVPMQINNQEKAMVVVLLWLCYLRQSSYVLIRIVSSSPASMSCNLMAPCGRKPHPSSVGSLCDARDDVVVADFYHDFVPEEDQVTMPALEAEVRLVREFKDDEEVE